MEHLTDTQIEELNQLLSDKKINLPDHRRKVQRRTHNYQWLQSNILTRNPNISDNLRALLNLPKLKTTAPSPSSVA